MSESYDALRVFSISKGIQWQFCTWRHCKQKLKILWSWLFRFQYGYQYRECLWNCLKSWIVFQVASQQWDIVQFIHYKWDTGASQQWTLQLYATEQITSLWTDRTRANLASETIFENLCKMFRHLNNTTTVSWRKQDKTQTVDRQ